MWITSVVLGMLVMFITESVRMSRRMWGGGFKHDWQMKVFYYTGMVIGLFLIGCGIRSC